MRKRYSAEDLEYIKRNAKAGVPCEFIANKLGVSSNAIKHVLSRLKIRFCRKPFTQLPGEVWLPCPNIPDLQVSDKGRFVRISSESLITGFITTGGYLTLDVSGVGRFTAHRLIAQAFIPNPENKPEVNHKDGNKLNNRVDNLEWVTPVENMRHAITTGLKTFKSGQDHHRTALTTAEIEACVKLHDDGKSYREISSKFGVDRKTVSKHVDQYRRSTECSETIPQRE